MKEYLKLLGAEIVYILIIYLGAVAAVLMQFVARKYYDHHSSFIFSGDLYTYNPIAYIAGIALFAASFYYGYRFWFKRFVIAVSECNWWKKTIFCVVALLFSAAEFMIIMMIYLLILGLGDDMRPEYLFYVTSLGWPIVTAIVVIVSCLLKRKSKRVGLSDE